MIDYVIADAEDPSDVNYASLPTKGAVVHAWFDDVGMFSPPFKSEYLPKMNVVVRLLYPQDREYIYDERLHYGIDASDDKSKTWSLPSDPKYRFSNFDALINNVDTVVEGFDAGIYAIANRAATEFKRVAKR